MFGITGATAEPAPSAARASKETYAESRVLDGLIASPPRDLAKLMKIHPTMAKAMLERNKSDEWRNRPLSQKGVERYASTFKRGKWMLTGEPIIFSRSGNLLNGQTRLTAAVAADATFTSLVVFGIHDDAFAFMDIGIARTAAHIFDIEEVPNAASIASVARLVWAYATRHPWDGRYPQVENDILLEFYYKNPKMQDSLAAGRAMYADRLLPISWAGMAHYVCALKSRPDADQFFDKIASGAGLSKRSPEFEIRKRLLANARANSAVVPNDYMTAYLIKAWNAKRQNRPLKGLRWRGEQAPTEAFPRAV